ncbi:hypothetical protein SAMN05444673_3323 [Bacillus sp. OV166]|nr:hypothetical protein SAMN05444673_3323 [Bacillus sp. OV166]
MEIIEESVLLVQKEEAASMTAPFFNYCTPIVEVQHYTILLRKALCSIMLHQMFLKTVNTFTSPSTISIILKTQRFPKLYRIQIFLYYTNTNNIEFLLF